MLDPATGTTGRPAAVVGRDPELAAIADSLAGGVRALVIVGAPGIGKTTLWETAVAAARDRGDRVLTARPGEAETRLPLAALADLIEPVVDEVLEALPEPQRHALEVALLRVPASGAPQEPRSIAAATRGALHALAARGPLAIAVDDVQWLDTASEDALAVAARRLADEPVTWLLAERAGVPSRLRRSLSGMDVRAIEPGLLSLGAARHLLAERLALSLPRRAMRRVHEATRGNPLFLLALGRTLSERGAPWIGDDIPIPDTVEDLLGIRVSGLPRPVRHALLAVAVGGDLPVAQLSALAGAEAFEAAVEAGVLVSDGERARAAHPLLATAALARSASAERRAVHGGLARVVGDEDLAARHLAVAANGPDAGLAATLDDAARRAHLRGAADDAVALADHALRLTPPEDDRRTERILTLAQYLMVAGEPQRARDLLEPEADRLPAGPSRARALVLLADGRLAVSQVAEAGELLQRSLIESAPDPALHALVAARRVRYTAVACVERIAEAGSWAVEALPGARSAGVDAEREVLIAVGWTRILRGRPIDDLLDRSRALAGGSVDTARAFEWMLAERHAHRGEVRQARDTFTRMIHEAEERGELTASYRLRLSLSEVMLRAGEWAAAEQLLGEWDDSPGGRLMIEPARERCLAFLAVGRGDASDAERWASTAIEGSDARGFAWHRSEAMRAAGMASLLSGDPGRAVGALGAVWDHMQREGVEDPGVFPVAPELVEALVETGDPGRASEVTARLARLAEEQAHPWARASVGRCEAIVATAGAAGGSTEVVEEAARRLLAAAAAYERLDLRFDSAKCLLILGRAERRARRWGAARRTLERAAAAFEDLGSPGGRRARVRSSPGPARPPRCRAAS